MDLTINASTQDYLASLQATQNQLQQAQAQVSSGLRLQQPSDDPSAIAQIYQLQTAIGFNQQTQTNLSGAQTEVDTADTAIQSAIQAVQSALSLAAEGANTSSTPQEQADLAEQVSGLQQTLVSLSQTQVNGSYIFSGDQSTQPPYELDPSQPDGVLQLVSSPATRVIQDVNGTSISTALTAQQIFDAQDSNGNPTTGNVFAAINSLLTSLQNNDTAGISSASDSLNAADTYLNQQLAFYGQAENRLTSASDVAQKFLTQEQSNLSQVQDADVPTAALQLTQAQTQQQAALSVEAKLEQQPTLFSFLG